MISREFDPAKRGALDRQRERLAALDPRAHALQRKHDPLHRPIVQRSVANEDGAHSGHPRNPAESLIEGLNEAEDVMRTIAAIIALGAEVAQAGRGEWRVRGSRWRTPDAPIGRAVVPLLPQSSAIAARISARCEQLLSPGIAAMPLRARPGRVVSSVIS